jgi:hypothetical protein
MNEDSNVITNKVPTKGLSARSAGIASILLSVISVGLYILYFQAHMRLFHRANDGISRMMGDEWPNRIDAISNFRFMTVIIAFILAIMALRKQPRWIGWVSLLICLIAGFVSTMILM